MVGIKRQSVFIVPFNRINSTCLLVFKLSGLECRTGLHSKLRNGTAMLRQGAVNQQVF
jgi:hypothetical protein